MNMRSSYKFALKLFLILLALVVVAFLFQVGWYFYKIKTGKLVPKFTTAKTTPKKQVNLNTKEILGRGSPFFGSRAPELTIVEFASFSCPYSKEVSSTARELMLKYNSKIKYIYREFPVDDLYPESSTLALLGRCANEQNKFWQMHDKLYQSTGKNYSLLAQQIGLDNTKLANCVKEQRYIKNIKQDLIDGVKNNVRGTPTFFFIKKGHEDKPIKIEGAIPKKIFEETITKLLQNS